MASLPAPDVTMDMSSPTHRGMDQDNDIEIDFGDFPVGVDMTDDEHMLEDSDQLRADTATDEMMDEEDHAAMIEEVMQDDPAPDDATIQADYDDELIDYSDDDTYQDPEQTILGDTAIEDVGDGFLAPTEVPTETDPEVEEEILQPPSVVEAEQVVEETVYQPEDDTVEAPVQAPLTETMVAAREQPVEDDKVKNPQSGTVEDAAQISSTQIPDEAINHVDSVTREAEDELASLNEQYGAGPENQAANVHQYPASDTIQNTVQGVPTTTTDTGLHPIMVNYREIKIPLFKSRTAHNGLLEDDNLASLSLSEVMSKCREQIAINTGEKVSDDQKLSMYFDHMRSTLRENDPQAFEFSMKEVLDNFVYLHRNDNVHSLPAMCLTLSLDWNFSKLLHEMKHAATQGYGLSNFQYVKTANENYYQDDEGETHDEEYAVAGEEFYEVDDGFDDDQPPDDIAHTDESTHDDDQKGQTNDRHNRHEQVVKSEPNNDNQRQLQENLTKKKSSYQSNDSAALEESQEISAPLATVDDQEDASAESPASSKTLQGDADNGTNDDHKNFVDSAHDAPALPTYHPKSANADRTNLTESGRHEGPAQNEEEEQAQYIEAGESDTADPVEPDSIGHDDAVPHEVLGQTEGRTMHIDVESTKRHVTKSHGADIAPSGDTQDDQVNRDPGSEGILSDALVNHATGAFTDQSTYEYNDEEYDENPDPEEEHVVETYDETDTSAPLDHEDPLLSDLGEQTLAKDELHNYRGEEEHGPENGELAERADDVVESAQNGDHTSNEDDIGFDDDDFLQVDAPRSAAKSPRAKRRFEEHSDDTNTDYDYIDFGDDEPEQKKARAA